MFMQKLMRMMMMVQKLVMLQHDWDVINYSQDVAVKCDVKAQEHQTNATLRFKTTFRIGVFFTLHFVATLTHDGRGKYRGSLRNKTRPFSATPELILMQTRKGMSQKHQ